MNNPATTPDNIVWDVALPQYLIFFCICGLLAITGLTRINYLMKICIIAGLSIGQAILCYTRFYSAFDAYVAFSGSGNASQNRLFYLIIIGAVLIALILINRQFELMTRRLFLWQKDVEEQREKVFDMRRKNEMLVYNILPPHVAIHFLGKRKNDDVNFCLNTFFSCKFFY